jgi:hypothetical protein
MATERQLKNRQTKLKMQVQDLLGDFLVGSVSTKGPKRPGFNLTYKIDQITKSRHIRKNHEKRVARMTKKHKRIKQLLQLLTDVNWELLKLED